MSLQKSPNCHRSWPEINQPILFLKYLPLYQIYQYILPPNWSEIPRENPPNKLLFIVHTVAIMTSHTIHFNVAPLELIHIPIPRNLIISPSFTITDEGIPSCQKRLNVFCHQLAPNLI